jgi:hypothetical protein
MAKVHHADLVVFNKATSAMGFAIAIATALSKISFAITLLRLSRDWTRALLHFIIISLSVVLGGNALIIYIHCSPVTHGWDRSIPGTCWPVKYLADVSLAATGKFLQTASLDNLISIVCTAYSAAMDFVLAFLSWTIIRNAPLKNAEKIGVGVAMSMGVL